jgi:PAS domain S-box-containing protein
MNGMNQLAEKKFDFRLEENGKHEFIPLAASFNDMVHRLKESYAGLERQVEARTEEIREANDHLLVERNQLRTLIDNVPDIIYFKDAESRFILTNVAHLRLLGARSEADVVGKTDHELHPSELADEYFADEQEILRTGQAQVSEEQLVIDNDGNRHWVSTTKVPLTDESGKPTGIMGIGRDITERKALDDKLKEVARVPSENPNPVLRISRDGKLLYSNPSSDPLLAAWGVALGGTVPERWVDLIAETMAAGSTMAETEELEGLALRLFVIPIADRGYVNIYGYDISRQKTLEAQLLQSQKLEAVGTLAGGVAHEINNPINGIMNYAQLIKDKMEPESREHEFASEIILETERVATIVRNLLTFARDEKQTHSPARIIDIVEGVTSLIKTVLGRDQIDLEVDVSEDLPKVKCRSQQIQQVVMNLVTNARDALNQRYDGYDENKKILISSHVFEREGRRWLRTTVEDHGGGILPEVAERMFEPFYTTKDRAKGTGLGLSISHGIVAEHRGDMSVESEPGEYTRFHLDLPVDNGWELED